VGWGGKEGRKGGKGTSVYVSRGGRALSGGGREKTGEGVQEMQQEERGVV